MKIKEIRLIDDSGKTYRIIPYCNVKIQMVMEPMYCHIKLADGSEKIINTHEPYFVTYEPFEKDERAIYAIYDDGSDDNE